LDNFRQVQVHRLGVGAGQDEGGGGAAGGADRAKDVGPFVTLIARRARTRSPLGPDAGQRALLADARFVLEPDFDGLSFGVIRDGLRGGGAEVF